MKRAFLIIVTFVLCSCLLLCEVTSYGNPFKRPMNNTVSTVSTRLNRPLLNSPMALLFPYESFSDHEVCRRPALAFPSYNLGNFHFTRILFQTKPAGNNFLQVNENMVFQKGNSFLLIPKTFALPVYPGLQLIPKPSLDLTNPD